MLTIKYGNSQKLTLWGTSILTREYWNIKEEIK